MSRLTHEKLIQIEELAARAGQAILEDKRRTSTVELKADESPLTSADMASHVTIMAGLAEIDPELPVLSEESKAVPYETRQAWSQYYLVDPLDGTKEFIKGKKDYTVNIALIEDGVPTAGVVYVPELREMYSGAQGLGAFKSVDGQGRAPIQVRDLCRPAPRIVGSVSHASPVMKVFLELIGPHEMMEFGSSLKICQVSDGTADFYPRFGPTSEWDTAAGHAVVLYAGGKVLISDGTPLRYNQKDSLLNPFFFVVGAQDRDLLALARKAIEQGDSD
jgi:3'(2'), 5'-bisphosphate nucleotidase